MWRGSRWWGGKDGMEVRAHDDGVTEVTEVNVVPMVV